MVRISASRRYSGLLLVNAVIEQQQDVREQIRNPD
jgi:hypothetical protein